MRIVECQCYELRATIEIGAYKLPDAIAAVSLSIAIVLFFLLSVSVSSTAAFCIQFFVSPNFYNALRNNDFFIKLVRKFTPFFLLISNV